MGRTITLDVHGVADIRIDAVKSFPARGRDGAFAACRLTIVRDDGAEVAIDLYSPTREQLDRLRVDSVSAVLDQQFQQAAVRA